MEGIYPPQIFSKIIDGEISEIFGLGDLIPMTRSV